MTIAELCREQTLLNARQIGIWERIKVVFPFLADLVHGRLSAYIPAKKSGYLLIAAEVRPHTVYMIKQESHWGKLQLALEEPLVQDTLRTGQPGRGKREWTYGSFIDMYTYAIHDGNDIIGVVSFEVDGERLQIEGFHHLLSTAVDVMNCARRGVEAEQYSSISPSDGLISGTPMVYKNLKFVHPSISAAS